MIRRFLAACLTALLLALSAADAQPVASFTVEAGSYERTDTPIAFPIDGLNYNPDRGALVLYETTGGVRARVAAQVDISPVMLLRFVLSGVTQAGMSRTFSLALEERAGLSEMTVQDDGRSLHLGPPGKPVLSYRYEIMPPPEGASGLYRRSGYIHPLRTPAGQILTRIQPPDHYHHYGIWGPWTRTFIGGREVDFWNLYKGEGTVRFAGFLSRTEGPVFSAFRALQHHIDFKAAGEDQTALAEVLEVRAWRPLNRRVVIDYTTTFSTFLDSTLTLAAYRYGGGIGFRATEAWTRSNTSVLTSEGKTRADADGSRARWCLIQADTPDPAGILFMSHPVNHAFPEPMRVWPEDANEGRGDVFFEFTPIRHNDWSIEKDRQYSLRYRMLVFDGHLTPVEARSYWQDWAHPPTVILND